MNSNSKNVERSIRDINSLVPIFDYSSIKWMDDFYKRSLHY
nr:MAG TPA: hypothetical protein [Caudoviricetes sp.]